MRSPPRVFISYSHDSPEHAERVLALADRLRADGIEAWIDQYEPSPPQGWPRWTTEQIKNADFVLTIVTETYARRFRGDERSEQGLGVVPWEGAILTQNLYEYGAWNAAIVLVILTKEDARHIPPGLRCFTYYDVGTKEGYEQLYRHLTAQPEVLAPPMGESRRLPSRVPLSHGAIPLVESLTNEREPQRSLKSFLEVVPWAGDLLRRLRQDGAKVRHARVVGSELETQADRWLIRARIRRDLRRLYGTATEILILIVPDEVEGKDLNRAQQELYRPDLDLDPDLLVVVDGEADLAERLSFMTHSWGQ